MGRHRRSAWTLRAAVCLVAAGLLAPGAASASAGQESVFMDDNRLLYRGNAVTDNTLEELRDLGVDRVRVSVHWRSFTPEYRALTRPASLSDPTDPAQYADEVFDNHDHLLRKARQFGIEVLLNVTGTAPIWATGRKRGKPVELMYKPNAREFGRFVAMLGKRYGGGYKDENQGEGELPKVTAWSIWNEPNQKAHLQPQWERDRKGRWRPAAPRIYRNLVRAAIAGLRATGHGGDIILLGETAPLGDSRRSSTSQMRPGLFLRELFCLNAALRPRNAAGCDFARRGALAVSGYAHHPYSVVAPPQQSDAHPDHIVLADRSRLYRLLDAAAAAGRTPAGLRLWITEYGYQTRPPDPIRGVALEDQARWLAQAEHLTWQDGRVASHTQFLLRDDEPRRHLPAGDSRYWGTYQSGLEFENGENKPAYDAYRLPLVATGPARLWGLVRPGRNGTAQSVRLQFKAAGAAEFQDAGQVVQVDDPRGYFEVDVAARGAGEWRFVWSPPQPSPPGGLGALFTPPPPPPPSYPSVAARVG